MNLQEQFVDVFMLAANFFVHDLVTESHIHKGFEIKKEQKTKQKTDE